jgi:hypothetical protein
LQFIGYAKAALPLFENSGVTAENMDEGCVAIASAKDVKSFVESLARLRIWSASLTRKCRESEITPEWISTRDLPAGICRQRRGGTESSGMASGTSRAHVCLETKRGGNHWSQWNPSTWPIQYSFKVEVTMDFGKGALLWLIGIPLPIILLLAIFMHH